MTPCILVAGIGNILLQDDGLGPQAIAQLRAQYEFGDELELFDLGTATLDFFDNLRGHEVLVLIDAPPADFEPGELLTFDKEQLKQFLPTCA